MHHISNFYIKHRKQFFIFWTVLLLFISAMNFYFIFEVTYRPNDECIWQVDSKNKQIIFRNVKIEGVTWQAGIRENDILLEVEGIRTFSTHRINRILLDHDDNIVEYKVKRGNEIFETNVEIKKLISFNGFSATLFSTIWLLIGFVVVMSKRDGEVQIVFFRIGAAFVLYSMFNLMLIDNYHNPIFNYAFIYLPLDFLQILGSSLIPFLLLHFFWIFPKRTKVMEYKHIYKMLYLSPLVLFLAIAVIKGVTAIKSFEFYAITSIYIRYAFSAPIIFAAIVNIVYLVLGYLKIKKGNERTAVLFILMSYIFTIAVLAYALTITAYFINAYNTPYFYMPVILVILLPTSFAYAVFRYSMLDVSEVIKTTILYGFATLALGGLYFLIIYLIGQEISQIFTPRYQGIIAAGIFIIFATVFQSTKDQLQTYITRKFYPEQFAYQRVLYGFSKDISGIIGKDKILDNTFNTFIEALKLNTFAIAIRDENDFSVARTKKVAISSKHFQLKEERLKLYLENRLKTEQMPIIDSTQFSIYFGEFSEVLLSQQIYTVIPLLVKNEIIGFLLFGLKYSGAKFSGKDIELLVTATNQVASQLENSRLYEAEAENLKMHRDLENARNIQQTLLPASIPTLDNLQISGAMIPAMMVGGDYFDVIKVSDTKLFAVIGDVSGKGLSASFYMSKLQTMVRLFCKDSASPKDIILKINKHLFDVMKPNWFITVTIALFNSFDNSIKICRAGHTPVLLLKNNNRIFYTPSGMGVGINKSQIFADSLEEFTTTYEKDETYLFFSDGLTEAMNSSRELYGDERLLQVLKNNSHLPASEIQKKILDSVKYFRGQAETNDDITTIVVKCA